MPLTFPTSRIVPEEDPTERAMHRAIDIAHDFEHAIIDATSVAECLRLHARIHACLTWLNEAAEHALDKADRF